MKKILTLLVFVLLFSGCNPYFTNPDKSIPISIVDKINIADSTDLQEIYIIEDEGSIYYFKKDKTVLAVYKNSSFHVNVLRLVIMLLVSIIIVSIFSHKY